MSLLKVFQSASFLVNEPTRGTGYKYQSWRADSVVHYVTYGLRRTQNNIHRQQSEEFYIHTLKSKSNSLVGDKSV